jgi:dTDP-4-dehydrorhamnose reductase
LIDTIWVTGAGGLLGGYVVRLAPKFLPSASVAGLTRARLDLLNFTAVQNEFRRDKPQAIIHCAALSRSPDCEAKPELARRLNVDVTRVLSELASDIPFVFFSSDLVFDGREGNYDESAAVNPLSVYAQTKAEAERVVLANPRHTVIRTSLNGGNSITGDRGFNEQLRRDWAEGRVTRLFSDEFRSPIFAALTVRAACELLAGNRSGIFHVAGSERLSRLQIGELVASRWPQLKPKIEPASLRDYIGPARPPDSTLNCRKAQAFLSFQLPGLTEWLNTNQAEVF